MASGHEHLRGLPLVNAQLPLLLPCLQFHNPHDEPVAPGTITIPIDDNTKVRLGGSLLSC